MPVSAVIHEPRHTCIHGGKTAAIPWLVHFSCLLQQVAGPTSLWNSLWCMLLSFGACQCLCSPLHQQGQGLG